MYTYSDLVLNVLTIVNDTIPQAAAQLGLSPGEFDAGTYNNLVNTTSDLVWTFPADAVYAGTIYDPGFQIIYRRIADQGYIKQGAILIVEPTTPPQEAIAATYANWLIRWLLAIDNSLSQAAAQLGLSPGEFDSETYSKLVNLISDILSETDLNVYPMIYRRLAANGFYRLWARTPQEADAARARLQVAIQNTAAREQRTQRRIARRQRRATRR